LYINESRDSSDVISMFPSVLSEIGAMSTSSGDDARLEADDGVKNTVSDDLDGERVPRKNEELATLRKVRLMLFRRMGRSGDVRALGTELKGASSRAELGDSEEDRHQSHRVAKREMSKSTVCTNGPMK
jgi:hypothetical protein